MQLVKEKSGIKCFHCGDDCKNELFRSGEKVFCCSGCKTVYEILNGNNLCDYYSVTEESRPGLRIKDSETDYKFDYLDDRDIRNKIIDFTNKNISTVTFYIPSIHCSSCIWLLEKLFKIEPAVLSSNVNFLEKKLRLTFDNNAISLKDIVKLLYSIGYEPLINFDSNEKKSSNNAYSKKLYLKIGVAGFCLGNIMLLSLPEYLSMNNFIEGNLRNIFNYLNLLLSIPVFFYCASDYFSSAWNGLRKKFINIDFPISLGLTALFIRSLYEIILFDNAGFIDSLAGLVFLLLLGKLFQNKTYESINFERDYKSYFPVSVTIKSGNSLKSIPVAKLKVGNRIIIRNNEIIPTDTILFNGNANIDYSFVNGESIPEQKVLGEIIYAGGRHIGSAIELEVIRTVSQSYLTQLWNDDAFSKNSGKKTNANLQNLANSVSKYFTAAILLIAFGSAFYWYDKDLNLALNAFTTVLIIACPCALALTTPFALGNTMRIFGRNNFYLKNANVIEEISKINSIVFDKTGTITNTKDTEINFSGSQLTLCELALVKSLVRNSSHPLSKKIYDSISINDFSDVTDFTESISEGISCRAGDKDIKLGTIHFLLDDINCSFISLKKENCRAAFTTKVFLSIDNKIKGYFSFNNKYRSGFGEMIKELSDKYDISVISGDNDSEKNNLIRQFEFKDEKNLLFNKTPAEKLNYIKLLQKKNKKVMMIGDGLNDAGALKQSEVGVSVTDDISNFSPSCDAIIDASEFSKLSKFINFSSATISIIKVSFGISFLYNLIGLYLAVQGTFSPLIAAILMPFNSISIILFVTGATNLIARRRKLL